MMMTSRASKVYSIIGILLTLLVIATVAITVATLVIVVKRLNSSDDTTSASGTLSYADQIKIDDLMKHLNQLQAIADQSNGTRAIATRGFNDTLDYITSQLEQHTNFIVNRRSFTVQNYIVRGTPQLQATINGNVNNYVHIANFTYMVFSARATFSAGVRLVAIPNLGCRDEDWSTVSAENAVALVKRGDCNFPDKSIIAEKYRVRGLLIYNDGTASDRFQAVQGLRVNMNSTIPSFFISYNVGIQLLNAIADSSADVTVQMNVDVSNAEGIGNICADTQSGSKTKTIVVGAHSDGVPAGSGINDNGKQNKLNLCIEFFVLSFNDFLGSGTIGVLVLALNLARLFQKSSSEYSPYPYRVRFCWWGAEEIGLLGSIYHVEQAALATTDDQMGERLSDYLVNLNYDMLAGPNYRFGIHDSNTAPTATPAKALNGTKRITDLFRQWFNEQNLPWSNASLGGGSDYVPFLARGLAVGGVNTGAGGIKSATERDQYTAILGAGNGGIANAAFDPCYHQQCDRITNINPFAYEKVVKAAAYAIEYMGRMNDLEKWLYPQGRSIRLEPISRNQLLHDDPNLF